MTHSDREDPCGLGRFVLAQEDSFDRALSELRRGRKTGHWMWFIFPQLAGLGASPMSQTYALHSLDEASAFLAHPVLGPRLVACCRALLAHPGGDPTAVLGTPDDMKLRSCATLFARVPDAPSEFGAVLEKFFGGRPDPRTLELLGLAAD